MSTQVTPEPQNDPVLMVTELPSTAKIQRRLAFVENVVPFLTSVLLHVVLIAGLYVAAKVTSAAVEKFINKVKSQEQVIVPDAGFEEDGEGGGIPHPGTGGDPTRDAAQMFADEAKGIADKTSETLNQSLMGNAGETKDDGVVPIGLGVVSVGHGEGVGGAGAGDGSGEAAPFGVPGGGMGIGPKGPFGKPGGNAKFVAFVADASGSMEQSGHFDDLRAELRKYVTQLKGAQSFNVIFFRETEAGAKKQFMAASDRDLLIATPEKKAAALKFLEDTTPGFATDPRSALQAAFAMTPRPQVVWFLTDGDFDKTPGGNEAVVEFIRNLNKDKKSKVNTMLFFSVNPDEKGYQNELDRKKNIRAALERISQENGGKFYDIHKDDLTN